MVMRKTTIYLPEDLSSDVERAAKASERSETDLIREGIRRVIEDTVVPGRILPLFDSGDPHMAERVDGLLAGFGED
jgi:hypothetical protein